MNLAVQNFTCLMRNLPLIMLYTGEAGAVKTLKCLESFRNDDDKTVWEKAVSGARISAIFVAIYGISSTLEQYARKSHRYSDILLWASLFGTVEVFPRLYNQISKDLFGDRDDEWLTKIQNCAHNISAVMVSALVASIGIIILKTATATYLGQNLNAVSLSLTPK